MNVRIFSRRTAERLLQTGFPVHTAVVSFYNPPTSCGGSVPVIYTGKAERIFQMVLDDFQPDMPEATNLAQFIDTAISDGLNIICQCESGQSRSAGCAAAILEHYCHTGQSIFDDCRYRPDEMVYYSVLSALEMRGMNHAAKG